MPENRRVLRDIPTPSGRFAYDPNAPVPTAAEMYNLEVSADADFRRGLRATDIGLHVGDLDREADQAAQAGRRQESEQIRARARILEKNAGETGPRISSYQDVKGVGDAVDFYQQSAGQLARVVGPIMASGGALGVAGGIAGGIIGGPPGAVIGRTLGSGLGAALTAGPMEAGEQATSQQHDDYIRENTTATQRLLEQDRKRNENLLLEVAVPALAIGRIFKAAKVASSIAARSRYVAGEFLGEAITETIQTQRGQASLSRLNPNRDTSQDYVELIDSFIVGGFGGLTIGALSEGTGALLEQTSQDYVTQNLKALGRAGFITAEQIKELTRTGANRQGFIEAEALPPQLPPPAAGQGFIPESNLNPPGGPPPASANQGFIPESDINPPPIADEDVRSTQVAPGPGGQDTTTATPLAELLSKPRHEEPSLFEELLTPTQLQQVSRQVADPEQSDMFGFGEDSTTDWTVEMYLDLLTRPGPVDKQQRAGARAVLEEKFPEMYNEFIEARNSGQRQGTVPLFSKEKKAAPSLLSEKDRIDVEIREQYKAFLADMEKAQDPTSTTESESHFVIADETGTQDTKRAPDQKALTPVSGALFKGHSTPLEYSQVEKFTNELVSEGRISQQVADSSYTQPLGDYLTEQGGNLRAELEAIRRDVERRLKGNLERKGENRSEAIARLSLQLDSLRVDPDQPSLLKGPGHEEAALRNKLNEYAVLLVSSAENLANTQRESKLGHKAFETLDLKDKAPAEAKRLKEEFMAEHGVFFRDNKGKVHNRSRESLMAAARANDPQGMAGKSEDFVVAMGIENELLVEGFLGLIDPKDPKGTIGFTEQGELFPLQAHSSEGLFPKQKSLGSQPPTFVSLASLGLKVNALEEAAFRRAIRSKQKERASKKPLTPAQKTEARKNKKVTRKKAVYHSTPDGIEAQEREARSNVTAITKRINELKKHIKENLLPETDVDLQRELTTLKAELDREADKIHNQKPEISSDETEQVIWGAIDRTIAKRDTITELSLSVQQDLADINKKIEKEPNAFVENRLRVRRKRIKQKLAILKKRSIFLSSAIEADLKAIVLMRNVADLIDTGPYRGLLIRSSGQEHRETLANLRADISKELSDLDTQIRNKYGIPSIPIARKAAGSFSELAVLMEKRIKLLRALSELNETPVLPRRLVNEKTGHVYDTKLITSMASFTLTERPTESLKPTEERLAEDADLRKARQAEESGDDKQTNKALAKIQHNVEEQTGAGAQVAVHPGNDLELPTGKERIRRFQTDEKTDKTKLTRKKLKELRTEKAKLDTAKRKKAIDAAKAAKVVSTFKTAKGSSYVVYADGTTERDKAARNDPGHEGDSGAKPRSEKTVYIGSIKNIFISSADKGTKGARYAIRGDKLISLYWDVKKNQWVRAHEDQTFSTKPKEGAHPIELWELTNEVSGQEMYRTFHVGNAIQPQAAVATQTAKTEANAAMLKKLDGKLPEAAKQQAKQNLGNSDQAVEAANTILKALKQGLPWAEIEASLVDDLGFVKSGADFAIEAMMELGAFQPPVATQTATQPQPTVNQAPSKTASGNVVVKNGVPAAQAYANADPANRVYTLRLHNTNEHFGNPFSSERKYPGVVELVATTADAVQAYRDWLTTTKYDGKYGPALDARKKWILSQLPSLRGKELVYYKELNEPSHANALDELVQVSSQPVDFTAKLEEKRRKALKETVANLIKNSDMTQADLDVLLTDSGSAVPNASLIPKALGDEFQEWMSENGDESDWAWEHITAKEEEFLDSLTELLDSPYPEERQRAVLASMALAGGLKSVPASQAPKPEVDLSGEVFFETKEGFEEFDSLASLEKKIKEIAEARDAAEPGSERGFDLAGILQELESGRKKFLTEALARAKTKGANTRVVEKAPLSEDPEVVREGQILPSASHLWHKGLTGEFKAAHALDDLCIRCSNVTKNALYVAGFPSGRTDILYQVPGTERNRPHYVAITQNEEGTYFIVDDPPQNLYRVDNDAEKTVEVLKSRYTPFFIEVTAENIQEHYGLTKEKAEEDVKEITEWFALSRNKLTEGKQQPAKPEPAATQPKPSFVDDLFYRELPNKSAIELQSMLNQRRIKVKTAEGLGKARWEAQIAAIEARLSSKPTGTTNKANKLTLKERIRQFRMKREILALFPKEHKEFLDFRHTTPPDESGFQTAGVFRASGRIEIFLGHITRLDEAKWIVWHEFFHRGLKVRHGSALKQVLLKAAKNPTVSKLADAIYAYRDFDHPGSYLAHFSKEERRFAALEEALVELGAAMIQSSVKMKFRGVKKLEALYGVSIPKTFSSPSLTAVVKKYLKIISELFHSNEEEYMSDPEVMAVIMEAKESMFGAIPTLETELDSLTGTKEIADSKIAKIEGKSLADLNRELNASQKKLKTAKGSFITSLEREIAAYEKAIATKRAARDDAFNEMDLKSSMQFIAPDVISSVNDALRAAGFSFVDNADAPDISAIRRIASKKLRENNVEDTSEALSYIVWHELNLPNRSETLREEIKQAITTWITTGKKPVDLKASLWGRIKEIIERLIAFLEGKSYINLEKKLNEAFDKVISNPTGFTFRPEPGKTKTNFQGLIDRNPLIDEILNILNVAGVKYGLTGSMAYADQTSMYRNMDAPIHDVDLVFTTQEEIQAAYLSLGSPGIIYGNPRTNRITGAVRLKPGQRLLYNRLYDSGVRTTARGNLPWRRYKVGDADGRIVGSYELLVKQDGTSKDVVKGDIGIFVDFILSTRSRDWIEQSYNSKITNQQEKLQVSSWVDGFVAKLEFLRSKDITDLHGAETKSSLQAGKSAGSFKDINEALKNPDVKARRDAVVKYIATVLGPDVAQVVLDNFFIYGNLSKEEQARRGGADFNTVTGVIRTAIDSLDTMSLAFHESLHALVRNMKKAEGGLRIYNKVSKLAMAPQMQAQLRKLLAGNPKALEQLKDAEESTAYMYQFWAAGELKVQSSTQSIFRKWLEGFAKLLGYITRQALAEKLFTAFKAGELADPLKLQDTLDSMRNTGVAAVLESLNGPLKKAISTVLQTPIVRLHATGIDALRQLADKYFAEPKTGNALGLLQMISHKKGHYSNQYWDIIRKHKATPEQTKAALRNLQGQKESVAGSLEHDIRALMEELYTYATTGEKPIKVLIDVANEKGGGTHKEWVPLSKALKFFPRVWDNEAILRDKEGFTKLLLEEGKMSQQHIDDFFAALAKGDGIVDFGRVNSTLVPAFSAANPRSFDFINATNAHKFIQYQDRDMHRTMTKYIFQLVHRREHSRAFSHDGSGVQKLLDKAKTQGATQAQLEMATKAIAAMDGTLGTEKMTELKRNTMTTAITIINFAVLPLALFASLVDPLGVLVRTGSLPAAGKTFAAGVKQLLADFKGTKTAGQVLAEFLGIIQEELMLEIIGNTYNGMFMNQTLRKANNFFFKMIGLEQWTRGTRIGALNASVLYLRDNKTNAKVLKELNLLPGDIKLGPKKSIKIKTEDGLSPEQAERVQQALFRMVDESILRPSSGTRPIWMSDIRFLLLGHLKQFTFTFHNTIVRQVGRNFKEQRTSGANIATASLQILPLLAYVPTIIAADMLRAIVAGRTDDDDDDDGDTFTTVMGNALQRSAIFGYGTFAFDIGDDMRFSGAPINTFLGPVADKSLDLVQSALNPNADFLRAASGILPFHAAWKDHLPKGN